MARSELTTIPQTVVVPLSQLVSEGMGSNPERLWELCDLHVKQHLAQQQ